MGDELINQDYYKLSPTKVLKELNSDLKKGLTNVEAKKRLESYGPNTIEVKKKLSAIKIFLLQFKNVMIYMLVAATLISFMIGDLIDAIVILIILLINVIMGFIQEYKAEKVMEALESFAAPKATVIRDGERKTIWSRDLVPGDIVVLNTGDLVPANIRLIQAYNLKVDQAHLTGESVPVLKSVEAITKTLTIADQDNMAFMGSLINYGRGLGIVTSTGMNTEIGQIAESVLTQEREETPLQKEIANLGKWLAIIVLIAVAGVFTIGLLTNQEISELLLTSLSLAVSAVPEGLPAVITVTLSIGMQRMAKKNAVVRKLSAVQTLGSVTTICTDKTGTLTKNEMTVTSIYDGKQLINVSGTGYEPKGVFTKNGKEVDVKKQVNVMELLKCGLLCNNAHLGKTNGTYGIVGDPTEGSLMVAAAKAGLWHDELIKEYDELYEFSFDSKRKRMSVVFEHAKKRLLYAKGAPDSMLKLCDRIMVNGRIIKLTDKKKKQILEQNKEMASNALRVLGLAYRELPSKKLDYSVDKMEQKMVFLGLVGMIDPARTEVKESIKLCSKAGIKVKMITGDQKLTAMAIGRNIGLFKKDSYAISGEELDKLSDDEFVKTVKSATIFARVSPEHKLRIVEVLKDLGEVVAVTGDGVNDAPALKAAHIGVAMGIKGTDVSKEASEMVLTDDNFATIVNAVEGGRGIFENIKKFVKFLLASNADTILIITFALLIGLPLPFLPLHILWMNLVTDGVPALALSIDSNSHKIMRRKPRDPKKSLIGELALFILVAGLVDAIAGIILFLTTLNLGGFFTNPSADLLLKARTMAISSAIFYELFFLFNCRDDDRSVWQKSFKENFLSNKKLTLAVIASVILQLCFIYLPIFNSLFKTAALSLGELGLVLFFSSWGLFIVPKYFHKELPDLFHKKI